MSSVLGILVFVAFATYLSPASAGFWSWWSGWSEEAPANCPHQNNDTHVCSTLQSSEGVCVLVDCCESFDDEDEEVEEYEDYSNDGTDEMSHHGGQNGGHHGGHHGGSCGLCASVRSCTLYKCYSSCCDGYERDYMGRCSNKTGNLQCENGGVLRRNWWGKVFCKCPYGFRGHNCETPICHCRNGGECVVKDGKPHCNCSYGYYGNRCEKSNCAMKCYNGGQCYKYDGKEFCWCPDNYIGSQCKKFYTNPEQCPVPEHTSDMCEYECTSNSGCKDNHVCCKEGCSSVCRETKPEFCVHEGMKYAINSTYSPDPCTTCSCADTGDMFCSSFSCAFPECLYGEPAVLPGQCCPSCPDKPDPPKMNNCPTSVLYLNTTSDSDQAWLDKTNVKITAHDSEGNTLLVKYRPEKVHHCHCAASASFQTLVQAYAMDKYSSLATCSFNVIVKDVYPPRFTYCPNNIIVSENNAVIWRQPTYEDNVGISRVTVPERESGDIFPVGNHAMTYIVWDHDGNIASCNFTVTISREPPKINNCPTDVLYMDTTFYTNYAVMNELATGIYAVDSENNKLQVYYEPTTVEHCTCSDSLNKEVKAMATDDYGRNVACTFRVIIKDTYLPKFLYCPGDMNVSEGETVAWKEPTYTDNVGVDKIELNEQNGDVFPDGKNTVTYNIWDYDGNKASCQFNIYVAESVPPQILNCPNYALILTTPATTDYVELSESTTSMVAYSAEGSKLKVNFRPSSVRHCYCPNSVSNETLVEAIAEDHYGNVVTCPFRVVVVDPVRPTITYCPEDMYVSETDVVTWRKAECNDNVQVARESVTGRKPGSQFPVGTHRVAYEFWDFDGNTASCHFNVTVAKAKCTLECYNEGVCYRNGNNQFCRCPPNFVGRQCEKKYIHTHCQHDGKQYMVNETYSPDPCSTCTCTNTGEMICSTVTCAMPKCAGGRQPVSKPGICCLECPEEPKPRITCPSRTVHLNTSYYSNKTLLDDTTTFVEASDSFDQKLQVHYRPLFVYHCNCHNPSGHETTVKAYAYDSHGNVATCSFKVVVRDIYPPTIFSCPENVNVFENEIVEWTLPSATDNVWVAGKSCSNQKNGEVFPLGEHRISCDIWDYDRNTASCHFRVSVIREDTPSEDMPLGHRERSTQHKKNNFRIILPSIFGAILLAVLAVLLLYFCRRKCQPGSLMKKSPKPAKTDNIYAEPHDIDSKMSSKSKRPSVSTYSTASSKTAPSRALSYCSNVYSVPCDVGIRPPPYTSHPYSPPPYSISGSVKDVTYVSLPPQSYHNPEYETFRVHRSSVYSPSVMSGSVASRASNARSSESSRRSTVRSGKSSKSSKSSYRA